jgi:endonuclease III
MAREPFDAKSKRALAILQRLDRQMPEAKIELDYRSPIELLVAVILSAQCTDKRVNIVTPALFARYPDAQALARARLPELEALIKTCGLYRSKAKNIIAAAQAIVATHGGEIPAARATLEALPGVGHKTAGVVTIHLGGDAAFPVDTHIRRLAYRMAFTRQTDPDKVELDLRELVPQEWWAKGHQLLIWHGRRTCFARSPACDRCVAEALCPKRGVKSRPVRPAMARKVKPRRGTRLPAPP